MNLTELAAEIDAATDVLRVETLDAYASSSDHDWVAAYLRGDEPPDPGPKQPWLDKLTARRDAGHPQQRLRIVNRPVSDYLRYASEWGYLDNALAGEDIRVVDEDHAPAAVRRFRKLGDLYVLDGRVLRMHYDDTGAFQHAYPVTMPDRLIRAARETFAWAVPFSDWWAVNPDLQRAAVTA